MRNIVDKYGNKDGKVDSQKITISDSQKYIRRKYNMINNEKEKKEKPITYFDAIDKYCNAVDKITPELQRDITEKNEISMPLIKLAEMMGYKFLAPRTAKGELVTMEEKILNTVYWRTKFCLFKNGIIVEPKKIDHEGFITMRPRPPRLEELRRHAKRTSLVEN